MYYDVISPVYWKYRDKGYTTENDVLSKDKNLILKREFEIDIAPFLRKINGTPSQEALTLARKLSIDLKDRYTIVKPHKRTYNKINNQIL